MTRPEKPPHPPVSVALCTCQGARWLEALLDSLARQSLRPHELVVCDDASGDATPRILERFAGAAPFPVRVHANARRLGTTRNFDQAVSLCGGEVIALCDQDDVWHADKLEGLAAALAAAPRAAAVFSDARLTDEHLHDSGRTLWQIVGFDAAERAWCRDPGQAIRVFLRHNPAFGMTLAFRARWRDRLLPIPEVWVHDWWIVSLLACLAPIDLVERPLVDYRQHAGNQIGGRRRGAAAQVRRAASDNAAEYHRQLAQIEALLERLGRGAGAAPQPGVRERLLEKRAHLAARIAAREHGRVARLPACWAEWRSGRYGAYALGWKSFVKDLIR